MATDPKKDEFKDSEITDEQLENVAGGDLIGVNPIDTVMPVDAPRKGGKTPKQVP